MNVVIVESPAKAKTINKYLGRDYEVIASFGHVRDLPAKDGSVDPDDDFAMLWEVDAKAGKRLAEIAKAVKGADRVILATDPDREGEAISWHVLEVLKSKKLLEGQARRPRCLQRDHQVGGARSDEEPAPDRHGSRRGLSRPPGARLSRRFQSVAGSVAQAAGRPLGRPRAIGGAAPRLRPRARNREIRPARILVARRPSAHPGRCVLHRPPRRRRRQEGEPARHRHRSGGESLQGGPGKCRLLGRRCRGEAGAAPPSAAVHDVDLAAGSLAQARLRAGADHADRPAPL